MQEKVVFITGGAKRVGAAICRKLHANGAKLIVHYRSSLQEAQDLQNELNNFLSIKRYLKAKLGDPIIRYNKTKTEAYLSFKVNASNNSISTSPL